MGDPNEPGRISVTLKQDGKDGTWIVFHGSPTEVRQQIIEVFAMDASVEGPPYELVNEATGLFKATGNVSAGLGGRVISNRSADTSTGTGSAWARAESGNGAEPKADPNVVRLTAHIEAASDVASLKELYARDKAAFDGNAGLLAAYKAKGKSLS